MIGAGRCAQSGLACCDRRIIDAFTLIINKHPLARDADHNLLTTRRGNRYPQFSRFSMFAITMPLTRSDCYQRPIDIAWRAARLRNTVPATITMPHSLAAYSGVDGDLRTWRISSEQRPICGRL